MSYYSDEPSADAGALPVWFLSEMTRKHVTVALSGEGSDELFGGYNTYLADRYAGMVRWTPRFLRRAGLSLAGLLPVSDDKISFEYKVKRFLSGSLLDPVDAHLYWNGVCSPGEKRALLGLPDPPMPGALFRNLPDVGEVNRFIYLDHLLYLPEDILYKCDRMSMAHSLEVRPPFLDHRIVEFAATLPERFKVHGSKLKFLLKELMRDKLPQPVLSRKKEGFDIPAHDWFRTKLKPLLLDTVTRRAVHDFGLLRWEAVERLMNAHFDRRINAGYHLWGLLTLFLWARRWSTPSALGSAQSVSVTN
jgi:asparagine synthase (glutamine-hydrolysing)